MTYAGVRGTPGVGFFRLGIRFSVTIAPRGGEMGGGDVPELAELFAEVHIGGRPVGWFTPQRALLPLQPYPGRVKNTTIELCCDLDRARVEAIEAVRAGGDLSLDVHLHWRLAGDTEASNAERVDVNQGVWVGVLGQLGYQRTLLIEVPVPDAAAQPELAEAVRLLGDAQGHMLAGRDREAVGALRDVLEAVARALGDDDKDDPVVNELFANQKTLTKAQRLRVVRRALKLVTHPARHRDQVAVGIDWGRLDSAQMIAMVAAFVNEMGAPDARPVGEPSPAEQDDGGSAAG